MVENFWLLGFVVAVFGVEWKFYTWHQPQIEVLEQKRHGQIKEAINHFLSRHGNDISRPKFDELLHEFVAGLSTDKDLILPVGGKLNPHRKIFHLLLAALILSALYGLLGMAFALGIKLKLNFSPSDNFQLCTRSVVAFLTICPLVLASWEGWVEFEYVLRIKDRFNAQAQVGSAVSRSRHETAQIPINIDKTDNLNKPVGQKANQSSVNAARLEELSREEITILKLFTGIDRKFEVDDVARCLDIHRIKADYLLAKLVDQDLLRQSTRIGLPHSYMLTRSGRAFLVEKKFV